MAEFGLVVVRGFQYVSREQKIRKSACALWRVSVQTKSRYLWCFILRDEREAGEAFAVWNAGLIGQDERWACIGCQDGTHSEPGGHLIDAEAAEVAVAIPYYYHSMDDAEGARVVLELRPRLN